MHLLKINNLFIWSTLKISLIIKDIAMILNFFLCTNLQNLVLILFAKTVEWPLIFFYVFNNVSVQSNEILCLDLLKDNNTIKCSRLKHEKAKTLQGLEEQPSRGRIHMAVGWSPQFLIG